MGRCIHDNFLLEQQTIKLLHQKKVSRLFLKLDISKAFDSVSWPFLPEVMNHLGFGQVWINLVSNLLSTSSTRILLNGAPGVPIHHQRGLRQGDPLSPMLFILVMDVLNSLFVKAGEEGLLHPLANRSVAQRVYTPMMWLYSSAPWKKSFSCQNKFWTILGRLQVYRLI